MSNCLMIIGMHRSGTSLTSSILQKAGLFIGDELLGAGESNMYGHFENLDFLKFQMKVLTHFSLDKDGWDLKTIDHLNNDLDKEALRIISNNDKGEWGWKDPRTVLFLKYWEKKISSAKYLFVYRDPWNVADSLFRRSNDEKILNNPALAFQAWDFYNREIIKMYTMNKDKSILIHIDDLVKDIPALINELNNRFGFHLKNENLENVFDESLYQSSDDNVFRSWQTSIAFPEVMETLNELRSLTGKEAYEVKDIFNKDAIIKDWVDTSLKTKKHKEQMQYLISDWHNAWAKSREVKNLKIELSNKNREIDWMKNTKFWKLREFWQKLRGSK